MFNRVLGQNHTIYLPIIFKPQINMKFISLQEAQSRINWLNHIIMFLGPRWGKPFVDELHETVAYIETLNWELGY